MVSAAICWAACFAAELGAASHPVVLSTLGAPHEARGEARAARAADPGRHDRPAAARGGPLKRLPRRALEVHARLKDMRREDRPRQNAGLNQSGGLAFVNRFQNPSLLCA